MGVTQGETFALAAAGRSREAVARSQEKTTWQHSSQAGRGTGWLRAGGSSAVNADAEACKAPQAMTLPVQGSFSCVCMLQIGLMLTDQGHAEHRLQGCCQHPRKILAQG